MKYWGWFLKFWPRFNKYSQTLEADLTVKNIFWQVAQTFSNSHRKFEGSAVSNFGSVKFWKKVNFLKVSILALFGPICESLEGPRINNKFLFLVLNSFNSYQCFSKWYQRYSGILFARIQLLLLEMLEKSFSTTLTLFGFDLCYDLKRPDFQQTVLHI